MAIQKINITQFLDLAQSQPVLDVRSPGEYTHAHIPGAYNLPLFTDEERKTIGTSYKQQSRQYAIKIGLDAFGTKMRAMVEEAEKIMLAQKKGNGNFKDIILIHCWRGGMRSAGVAWLLDLYGYKVYSLAGGYKTYRNWCLQQFAKAYNFKIIGGYTGSGKTLLLHALAKENYSIIDLEGLANHKGSTLGALGQKIQPTQEMFENLLAEKLASESKSSNIDSVANDPQPIAQLKTAHCIFLEDESQRIGNLQIPMPVWYSMRKAMVYFVDIPFEERLNYLTDEYGIHPKEQLVNAIMRIQKRLGGLETKNAINFLLEDNFKESFRILLKYYDKFYRKGLFNRDAAASLIKEIKADNVDTEMHVALLKNYL